MWISLDVGRLVVVVDVGTGKLIVSAICLLLFVRIILVLCG